MLELFRQSCWFDDLKQVLITFSLENISRFHGHWDGQVNPESNKQIS